MNEISRKTGEVAERPYRFILNLQQFSDESVDNEPVEPLIDDSYETVEPNEDNSGNDESVEAETPEVAEPEQRERQDSETNKAFQEMRKKMEALEKQNQFAKKYGQYGVFDEPDISAKYGQQGIHTIADLDAAIAREQREKEREEWIEQGLDVDLVDKYLDQKLSNHPDVIKGRQAALDQLLVNNYQELAQEYPDMVKSPEDISNEVWTRWNNGENGISLADAYTLVNRKEIVAKQQAAVKQAALNNLNGKNHMRPNGSDGSSLDTTQIPDDVMASYRKLFKGSGMTDKDFVAHYKKSQGGK